MSPNFPKNKKNIATTSISGTNIVQLFFIKLFKQYSLSKQILTKSEQISNFVKEKNFI